MNMIMCIIRTKNAACCGTIRGKCEVVIFPLKQSFGLWQYNRDHDEFVVVVTDVVVVVVVEIVVVDTDVYVVVAILDWPWPGADVVVTLKLAPPHLTLQT